MSKGQAASAAPAVGPGTQTGKGGQSPQPSPEARIEGPASVPEKWIRLSRQSGSTEVLELVTQRRPDGTHAVLSRQVRRERDIRAIQLAKAVQALEENAG